ncbi:CBS domain-containing protein [Spirilliplanes yamanashiensis]|nr:CBS domain-containing protein [Spirilliplanes yamanashiensis]MDP9818256.1 CBS domain-containing protein [Spirilliplanes yamanashiensis]
MSSPVHVIWQDAPVESAAELLTAHRVTALPVVDADGLLVGMVGESDLLWHRVPADPTIHMRRHPDADGGDRPGMVSDVMSPYPLTTTPEADVAEVAEIMLENDVRSVPVIQDRNVIGIVSRRDILRAMVRDDETLTHEVQHRLDAYADGARRWAAAVDAGVVTVSGRYLDETERGVIAVLARTVPGVCAVHLETVATT